MNILLTGSGGFIGKNLKLFLQDKYNLLCPRSFELDLTDEFAVNTYFSENKIDFIIHCGSTGGARGVRDIDTTVEDNLAMLNNLIEFKDIDVRIITFGSGAMYDRRRDLHKVKEDEIGKFVPDELYGLAKMKLSEIVKQRDDILMLNIFACYGFGEKENRFPSYAINQVLNHLPIEINQNVVFDYLWVEDMTKIVHYFIENKPQDKIINITPNDSISLYEIAEIINQISDYHSEIIIKNSKLNFEYTGDNGLLLKNIPNIKFTTIQDGLKKLYDYKNMNKVRGLI